MMKDFDRFNKLLLNLYGIASDVAPPSFQAEAFKQLAQAIDFDRGWWGIMARNRNGFGLHSSHRFGLPLTFEKHWEAVQGDDRLASAAYLSPRVTVHFDRQALRATRGLAELNEEHTITQALCTSIFLPDRKSFFYVSLFRSSASPFSRGDIDLKQALAPHLYSCWHMNLLADLKRPRHSAARQPVGTAFVDRIGQVICADPAFRDMVADECPGWRGRRLPNAFVEATGAKRPAVIKRPQWTISHHPAGGLSRIVIRRPSPVDRLTEREREITTAFATGRSYKEIAIALDLSPATVRHHLRVIYLKLDIHDKAELVRIVDGSDLLGDLPAHAPTASVEGVGMLDYLAGCDR